MLREPGGPPTDPQAGDSPGGDAPVEISTHDKEAQERMAELSVLINDLAQRCGFSAEEMNEYLDGRFGEKNDTFSAGANPDAIFRAYGLQEKMEGNLSNNSEFSYQDASKLVHLILAKRKEIVLFSEVKKTGGDYANSFVDKIVKI